MNSINYIKPGDIVREVSTARERVVTDVRNDLGLIAFEDSNLRGWTSMQGWVPTGKRVEK